MSLAIAPGRSWATRCAKESAVFASWPPRPYKRTSDDGEEEERLSFAAVAVFDAGQLTETSALPSYRFTLPDDQQERYAAVLAAVQAEGIRVEERDDLGSAEGYSAGGVIALRRGLDSRSRLLVLLHEWSHELLHKGAANTLARKEAQAEATAYVVSRHFGIGHPFAADYLQSWRVLTLEDLERELDAVLRAAGHIIDRLEANRQDDAGADVAA